MIHPHCIRPSWLLLALLLLSGGCTTMKTIAPKDRVPGKIYPRSRVYLKGGEQYEFDRVSFFPDSLAGEFKVQVEKHSDNSGPYYVEEDRSFRFPLNQVDSVAVVHRSYVRAAFYTAGLVALGVLADHAFGTRSSSTPGPSGGKGSLAGP